MAVNTKKFAGVVQATLAEKYDTTVTKKDCEKFVSAVLDSITACLADGESVKFTGTTLNYYAHATYNYAKAEMERLAA